MIVFHGDTDSTVHALNGSLLIDAVLGGAAAQATREIEPCRAPRGRAFTRTVYAPVDAAGPSRAEHWVVHGAGHAWVGGDAAGSYTESARARRLARDAALLRRASAPARRRRGLADAPAASLAQVAHDHLDDAVAARPQRVPPSVRSRLKISENVCRLATLKKHSAEIDMCRSIGSTSRRKTPASTPRS